MDIFNYRLREFQTRHVGTCYVGGSGAEKISSLIHKFDATFNSRTLSHDYTPADAFAEYVSCLWLYMETDTEPGPGNLSPIPTSSGGFLDWYRVSREGVRSWYPRLDLHIHVAGDRMHISRAYLSETLLIPPNDTHGLEQATHILGFIDEPKEIINDSHQINVRISRSHIYSYLCKQVFYSDNHLRARTTAKSLSHLYSKPAYIASIQLIFLKDGEAVYRTVRSKDKKQQAVVVCENDELHLILPHQLIFN